MVYSITNEKLRQLSFAKGEFGMMPERRVERYKATPRRDSAVLQQESWTEKWRIFRYHSQKSSGKRTACILAIIV